MCDLSVSLAPAPDPAAYLDESEHYLRHSTASGFVHTGVELEDKQTTLSVYRLAHPNNVWLSMDGGCFQVSKSLNLDEARLIRDALTKAVEDAEEAQRAIDWQRDIEIQEENDQWAEVEERHEAAERGEEWAPSAIGSRHLENLDYLEANWLPLPKWSEGLLQPKLYMNHAGGDGGACQADGKAHSYWFRWHTSCEAGLHIVNVLDTHFHAAVDDFGTLIKIRKALES